ncbi:hypothetical protein PR048_027040 [Dryococelus australis]|uniref:Uncharacterized protein n=1 Tax=Dryococelus australis TaxID=614101 RepID=A0ABQ9GEB5_9NEOP|nr:hypothetical protein PR048_027040 [Dryococelus australis]
MISSRKGCIRGGDVSRQPGEEGETGHPFFLRYVRTVSSEPGLLTTDSRKGCIRGGEVSRKPGEEGETGHPFFLRYVRTVSSEPGLLTTDSREGCIRGGEVSRKPGEEGETGHPFFLRYVRTVSSEPGLLTTDSRDGCIRGGDVSRQPGEEGETGHPFFLRYVRTVSSEPGLLTTECGGDRKDLTKSCTARNEKLLLVLLVHAINRERAANYTGMRKYSIERLRRQGRENPYEQHITPGKRRLQLSSHVSRAHAHIHTHTVTLSRPLTPRRGCTVAEGRTDLPTPIPSPLHDPPLTGFSPPPPSVHRATTRTENMRSSPGLATCTGSCVSLPQDTEMISAEHRGDEDGDVQGTESCQQGCATAGDLRMAETAQGTLNPRCQKTWDSCIAF